VEVNGKDKWLNANESYEITRGILSLSREGIIGLSAVGLFFGVGYLLFVALAPHCVCSSSGGGCSCSGLITASAIGLVVVLVSLIGLVLSFFHKPKPPQMRQNPHKNTLLDEAITPEVGYPAVVIQEVTRRIPEDTRRRTS
jgi:hypothetical protein